MRVYFNKSNKVMEKWPDEYWEELGRKLSAQGHDVASDITESDAYVGPPDETYNTYKGKRVALLGSMLTGEGVKAPIVCAGCREKIDPVPVDCFFSDEICMSEITPNDVLGVLCE